MHPAGSQSTANDLAPNTRQLTAKGLEADDTRSTVVDELSVEQRHEQLGRRCNAIEISPRYCDVIVRRYIAYVGKGNVDPELAERYSVPEQQAKQVTKKVGQPA